MNFICKQIYQIQTFSYHLFHAFKLMYVIKQNKSNVCIHPTKLVYWNRMSGTPIAWQFELLSQYSYNINEYNYCTHGGRVAVGEDTGNLSSYHLHQFKKIIML